MLVICLNILKDSNPSMNEYLKKALKDWYEASKIAEGNAALMCKNHGSAEECTRITNLCAKRMKNVYETYQVVLSFKSSCGKFPIELLKYWRRSDDKGCNSCWMSSSGAKHEECRIRMDDYFQSKEELLEFCSRL